MMCKDLAALLEKFARAQADIHCMCVDLPPQEEAVVDAAISTNESVVSTLVAEYVRLLDLLHLRRCPLREMAVLDQAMDWPERELVEAVKELARKEAA